MVNRTVARAAAASSLAFLLQPVPLPAQQPIASPEDCATLPSQDQELACLRDALRASRQLLSGRQDAVADRGPAEAQSTPWPEEMDGEQVVRRENRQSAERPRGREAIVTQVASSSTDHLGRLTVKLENGQIWQQAEPSALPLRPREGQRVEITRSGFGGYRMRFSDLGRLVPARRLK